MDRAEAIKILQTEIACVKREDCARIECAKCDLVLDQADILTAYELAIAALREQETVTNRNGLGWISVKDDIPKRMKRYFIAYQFEGSDMRFYGEAMFHPEGGNGCVDRPHFSNEGVDGMYVTHWMEIPRLPLPEPPKGE